MSSGRAFRCAVALIGAATLVGVSCARSPSTDGPQGTPTFTRDVAPILFRECATCHRPGGAGPFSVLTYQDAKQRARAMVAATSSRFMPPWLPASGYGAFTGRRHLSDREIETIRLWEAGGTPEGLPAALPETPRFTDGWQLGEPDLVVKLPKPLVLPAASTETWRNLVISVPLASTRFVKTVELRPGSPRVVHHALLGIDETRSSRRRDVRDAAPGFEGMDMGDSQAPDGHLLGWSPGMTPVPGIEGSAWRLAPGTDLVLQLHLMPSGKEETIDPLVGLFFADQQPAGPPLHLMRLDADQAIDIPADASHFVVSDTFQLPVDLEVVAVYPHAHFLATEIEASATRPDGKVERLIKIDKWDFKWQDIYRYAEKVFLPRGTTITMQFAYDNSAVNPRNPNRPPRRVVAGMRSSDEMAHLQLQVAARDNQALAALKEALNAHALRKNPGDAWAHYELGNLRRDEGRLEEAVRHYRQAIERQPENAAAWNNLGVALAGLNRIDEAVNPYREALKLEPDFAAAHYNLGNALRAKSLGSEALRHYREALRLEPDMPDARNNLGELLASQGRVSEAIEQFEEAIRLRPDSAEAHNNLGASLGMQGQLNRAIAEFREALRLDPEHARARENLKLALEGRGR